MKALKKYRWPLTGALLGVLVFLAVYGVRVLDPTSVDWILNSLSPDPIQHYLGWELFRRSPVHLPYIGANYNAVYPFRTSVLFTDSLPLAALFFKLLGGILPTRFQYFGWWGLLCYALQGGLAQAGIARIAGVQPTFGRDDKSKAAVAIIMSPCQTAKLWGSVLGAGVLVLFPALTIRMFAHTALAANWLVLLALYLWLRSDELMPTIRRACLIWGGMGLLCAGIHLYYLPMVLCLWDTRCAAPCKSEARRLCWHQLQRSALRRWRSWCCWGRSPSTLRATPTATSAGRTTLAWLCRGWRKAGSRMFMQASERRWPWCWRCSA